MSDVVLEAGDRLRVMHVLAPAPYGGLEQVVRALALGHAAVGHEVHVVAIIDAWLERHPFVDGLLDTPVVLHPLPVGARRYLHERREVGALIRSVRPDVVHTHGYRADVLSAPLARAAGLPTVTTVHGFIGGGWKNRLYERLQRRSFRRADAVVAVSAEQRDQLAADRRLRDRLRLIPNAGRAAVRDPLSRTESRDALGIPADAFAFGWVGRLSHEKGPDVMVDALERLCRARPDGWHAVFLGSGPLEAELRERVAGSALSGRVDLRGAVPEAARYFAGFDALVLSSRSEGLPIVLLEAVQADLPVVATRVGGIPDALTGRGGLVVPPQSPELLATALEAVLIEPEVAAVSTSSDDGDRRQWLVSHESVYRDVIAAVST